MGRYLGWLFLTFLALGCTEEAVEGERFFCEDDRACLAGYHCAEGVCVAGPAPECADTCAGVCVGGACLPACDEQADCTDGVSTCQGGACQPLRCGDAGACPPGRLCAANGVCVPDPARCGDTVCDDGKLCVDAVCRPACGRQVCEAGTACVNERCEALCGDDICAELEVCVEGRCMNVCGCPHDEVCTPEGCRCGDGPACENGERCEGETCVDPCGGACGDGEWCDQGACRCGAGPGCGPGGLCVDEACQDLCVGVVCGPGQVCAAGACQCGDGPACGDDAVCWGGDCVGGCVRCQDEQCEIVDDCTCGETVCDVGEACSNDACWALCDNDLACPDPNDACLDGLCVSACDGDDACRRQGGLDICVGGVCTGPECVADEQCAANHICEQNRCVPTVCEDGCCDHFGRPLPANIACQVLDHAVCGEGCDPVMYKTYLRGVCGRYGECVGEFVDVEFECQRSCGLDADGEVACVPLLPGCCNEDDHCAEHQACSVATRECVADCEAPECCDGDNVLVGEPCLGGPDESFCDVGCGVEYTVRTYNNSTCDAAGACERRHSEHAAVCAVGGCVNGMGAFGQPEVTCSVEGCPECRGNQDCPANKVCHDGTCELCVGECCDGARLLVGAPCQERVSECDFECGTAVVEQLLLGVCTDEGLCEANVIEVPDDQVTITLCDYDAFCVEDDAGAVCLTEAGECTRNCQNSEICRPGQVCSAGRCRNPLCDDGCCDDEGHPLIDQACVIEQSYCAGDPDVPLCSPVRLIETNPGQCSDQGDCRPLGPPQIVEEPCDAPGEVCVEDGECEESALCAVDVACDSTNDNLPCRDDARCVDGRCAPWACQATYCNERGPTVAGWRPPGGQNTFVVQNQVVHHAVTGLLWSTQIRPNVANRAAGHLACAALGEGWRLPSWFELLTVAPLHADDPPVTMADDDLNRWYLARTNPGDGTSLAVRLRPLEARRRAVGPFAALCVKHAGPIPVVNHNHRLDQLRNVNQDPLLANMEWVSLVGSSASQNDALERCGGLVARLATVLELASLISWHPDTDPPPLPGASMREANDRWAWSSDRDANDNAYLVNLRNGAIGTPDVVGEAVVRCLR